MCEEETAAEIHGRREKRKEEKEEGVEEEYEVVSVRGDKSRANESA